VWVELVVQSHGRLHVFLPLLDRGIDALIHRPDDGSWFPVQVKGRSQLRNGSLQIVAPAASLVDLDALLLGVALEDDHVGPFVLVITERDFTRIANRSHARGKPTFAAQVSLVPGRTSRREQYVFPREQLADALLTGIKPEFKVSPPLGFEVPSRGRPVSGAR